MGKLIGALLGGLLRAPLTAAEQAVLPIDIEERSTGGSERRWEAARDGVNIGHLTVAQGQVTALEVDEAWRDRGLENALLEEATKALGTKPRALTKSV